MDATIDKRMAKNDQKGKLHMKTKYEITWNKEKQYNCKMQTDLVQKRKKIKQRG